MVKYEVMGEGGGVLSNVIKIVNVYIGIYLFCK